MESLTRREFLFLTAAGAAAAAAGRVPSAAAAPPESMFRTASGWNLPTVVIDQAAAGTAPGLIFAAPFPTTGAAARGSSGPMIFDDDGSPVWFLPLDKVRAMNFKAQTYRGTPVLTWYESSGGALYGGSCVVYGHDYRELKRVHGGHEYAVDLHEFVLTSRGTALLAIANAVPVAGSRVVEGIVQEVDVESGKVLFEWHSLDHVPIDDSYRAGVAADGTVDYFHLNSIGVAPDGDLVVSARHTASVYKLDRRTGAVVWRLGGKHSDFTFAPGAAFWFQHDARMHADGTLSLFDNGATGTGAADVEAATRPLRLHLDTASMTAGLLQVFAPPSPRLATAMGNVQLLPDGGAFVGWGTAGGFTEFAPDGSVRLEAGSPTRASATARFGSRGPGARRRSPRSCCSATRRARRPSRAGTAAPRSRTGSSARDRVRARSRNACGCRAWGSRLRSAPRRTAGTSPSSRSTRRAASSRRRVRSRFSTSVAGFTGTSRAAHPFHLGEGNTSLSCPKKEHLDDP